MENKLDNWLEIGGRVLIAALFLQSGIGKIVGFEGAAGFIASAGVPVPAAAAVVAILVEVGLGLALLTGIRAKWAALGLAAFTCVATLLFHNFWSAAPAMQMVQKLMFMKNVAIVGGLLFVAAKSPFSVKKAA